MVLFPIVLMLVLGTALSGVFDSSAGFKDIKVIYTIQGEKALAQAGQGFLEKGREMGIKFTAATSVQQGLDNVMNGKYACYVQLDYNGVELYKNDRDAFKANLVEALLGIFIQRYNAITEIARVNPAIVSKITLNQNHEEYVKTSSLGDKREPKAMDYYAVTMLTLIIMYSSMSGAYAIKSEKTGKTANRLLSSPVGRHEILIGKTLGVLAITLLQVITVILFSKYILGSYWGSHLGIILMLVAAEVVMAVSLGLGLAFILKDEVLTGILNLLIPIVVFLGGGYMPIDGLGKTILWLSQISPLRWVNKAIFQVIYSNDFSSVATAIIINLGIAAVFLTISSFSIRKEVF